MLLISIRRFVLISYVIRLYSFISGVINQDNEMSYSAWISKQYCQLLYFTNYSVNFWLYSASNAMFRKCFYRLISGLIQRFCRYWDWTKVPSLPICNGLFAEDLFFRLTSRSACELGSPHSQQKHTLLYSNSWSVCQLYRANYCFKSGNLVS